MSHKRPLTSVFHSLHRVYSLRTTSNSSSYVQKFFLFTVQLKWKKDRGLDVAVEKEKNLRAVSSLKDVLKKEPESCLPMDTLSRKKKKLGIRSGVSKFIKKYPSIFEECDGDKYKLTKEALELEEEEARIHQEQEADAATRLCKLLMMTREKRIHLDFINQLKWDMGLPHNYVKTLVPNYPDYFSVINMPDNRPGLDLVCWNDELAVSEMERRAVHKGDYKQGMPLAFPMNYAKGYDVKEGYVKWAEEWQRLPYISPYEDASHINPLSDLHERRVVGVLHELLHFMVSKRTVRRYLCDLREQLGLPEKFEKCFDRHPGIFYLCLKNGTVTVMLREAYKRNKLIEEHPLQKLRGKFLHAMKKGAGDRRKGLHKKGHSQEKGSVPGEHDHVLQKGFDNHEGNSEGEDSQEDSSEDSRSDKKDFSEDDNDDDDDEDEEDDEEEIIADEESSETDEESSQDDEKVYERDVRTYRKPGGRSQSSDRKTSNFKPSGRQDSDLKPFQRKSESSRTYQSSDRKTTNLKPSGRQGSDLKPFHRQSDSSRTSVWRDNNKQTSGRQDSSFDTSGRKDRSIDTSGRQSASFDSSGRQSKNFDTSNRQGRRFETSGRQGRSSDTSGRQGGSFDTSARKEFDRSRRQFRSFDTSARNGRSFDTSATQGRTFDTFKRKGRSFEISGRQGRSFDLSGKQGLGFGTSERRQGRSLYASGRRQDRSFDTSGKQGGSFDTSGEQGRSFDTSGRRRGRSFDTTGRRENNFKTSENQRSTSQVSRRQGSNSELSGSKHIKSRTSERRGSNLEAPQRQGSWKTSQKQSSNAGVTKFT
ncbi:hypothetical protein KI387_031877 [Taxus chinensis]|uniref:PORR domain-containing protein n=1 Tax=Taxus chinensis TaxID=29808 RepID=A0AA38BN06_TAXCH|nr:hypothetical protein KI387_031877 [Taxus chinensis]